MKVTSVAADNNVAFKDCAPFTRRVTHVNEERFDTTKDFDITIDVWENTVLVNDMRKWALNRRMIKRGSPNGYDPNENISSYRIYKF